MAMQIVVPSVGESITEGRLARWIKSDGDLVRQDEPIFELETDKASTEVPAPANGKLHIQVAEGETVEVGAVVGSIDESASVPSPASKPAAPPNSASAPPTSAQASPASPDSAVQKPVEGQTDEARLSPAARRLVAQRQLDPSQLQGTGRGGLITKEDILRSEATPPPVVPPPTQAETTPTNGSMTPAAPSRGERTHRQRMSSIRQRISERLVSSQQSTATLTTFNEADMTGINALRGKYKEQFKEKHGVGLGFMSFFVKACVDALKAFPRVNARIDGPDIVFQNFYDIGVAVSTDRGLMVPIIRDADQLSFATIEQQIIQLAGKAREGKISIGDLQGGTFTITNGGIFGSMMSTPILNPPQSAILGMHAIQKRPVAIGERIEIRPMMYLALSYDHRIIDGREAVLFLVRIKECLEHPERLLLDI